MSEVPGLTFQVGHGFEGNFTFKFQNPIVKH